MVCNLFKVAIITATEEVYVAEKILLPILLSILWINLFPTALITDIIGITLCRVYLVMLY